MIRRTFLAGAVMAALLFGGMAYGLDKAAGQGKLNMNTATIEEFQLLPGIGEVKAKSIVAYRKASGPFRSVDELAKVKGLGKKRVAKLKPYLKIDGKSDFEPAKQKAVEREKD